LHAQLVFQLFDLPAQWRLRNKQTSCCVPEMQVFGYGFKVLQVSDLHFDTL
jgi:hypothetical protein